MLKQRSWFANSVNHHWANEEDGDWRTVITEQFPHYSNLVLRVDGMAANDPECNTIHPNLVIIRRTQLGQWHFWWTGLKKVADFHPDECTKRAKWKKKNVTHFVIHQRFHNNLGFDVCRWQWREDKRRKKRRQKPGGWTTFPLNFIVHCVKVTRISNSIRWK